MFSRLLNGHDQSWKWQVLIHFPFLFPEGTVHTNNSVPYRLFLQGCVLHTGTLGEDGEKEKMPNCCSLNLFPSHYQHYSSSTSNLNPKSTRNSVNGGWGENNNERQNRQCVLTHADLLPKNRQQRETWQRLLQPGEQDQWQQAYALDVTGWTWMVPSVYGLSTHSHGPSSSRRKASA